MLRINEIILKSGLKKGFIAQKLGISLSTLTRYCSGDTIPTAVMLKKFSELLNKDINEFFLTKNDTNI